MRWLTLALCLMAQTAHAEILITSLSSHSLKIRPNFDGSAIVVFGSIERDGASISRAAPFQLAISVRGPATTFIAREKKRTFGFWINRDSQTLNERPASYFLATSREMMKSVDESVLRREKIGLFSLNTSDTERGSTFESALIRYQQNQGLYSENLNGVTFMTPTLFRATIPVPSNTPLGDYEVKVHLFAGGALLAKTSTNFEVTKAGFEAFVADLSQKHRLFYGLVAVLMALFTGWLASIIFRRD